MGDLGATREDARIALDRAIRDALGDLGRAPASRLELATVGLAVATLLDEFWPVPEEHARAAHAPPPRLPRTGPELSLFLDAEARRLGVTIVDEAFHSHMTRLGFPRRVDRYNEQQVRICLSEVRVRLARTVLGMSPRDADRWSLEQPDDWWEFRRR